MYNIKIPTSYEHLDKLGIMNYGTGHSYKCRKKKIMKYNKYIIDDSYTSKDLKELYVKEEYVDELWKTVFGYDSVYLVSNYGRVKRVGKNKEWFLLPYNKKNPVHRETMFVPLFLNGKKKEVAVHTLVAKSFLESPANINQTRVRHIDGTIYNNHVSNLEYVSLEQLGKLYGGSSNAVSVYKIDPNTYEIIDSFSSGREAAKEYYLSYQSVFDILNSKAISTYNGDVFIKEDEYDKALAEVTESKYYMFDSLTCESTIDTLENFSEKCDLNLHELRHVYLKRKPLRNSNIYVFDEQPSNDALAELHLKSKLFLSGNNRAEEWTPITINGFEHYDISNTGRVMAKGTILLPTIENGIKIVNVKKKYGRRYEHLNVNALVLHHFKHKNIPYEDILNMTILYSDGNSNNSDSRNMIIAHSDNKHIKEMVDEEIAHVRKKKKEILTVYDNLEDLANELNTTIEFVYHCISNNVRISNLFFQFKKDCKEYKYTLEG